MDAEEGKARLMQGPAIRRRRAAVTALTCPGAPASAAAEQACAGERLNAPLPTTNAGKPAALRIGPFERPHRQE